jgi:hypothetical protein
MYDGIKAEYTKTTKHNIDLCWRPYNVAASDCFFGRFGASIRETKLLERANGIVKEEIPCAGIAHG